MACNIPDEGLYEFADRVKGQTIIITGAANGIGKEAALAFAKRGANLVIGDVDVNGSEETLAEIKGLGGHAVYQACNVLEYSNLVSLFQLALSKFGRIDVVIPNAGVAEIGRLTTVSVDEQGLPTKPNLKTLEINLISVLHTAQLASHYLTKNEEKDSLKALVLVGSMASIMGIPGLSLYSASKHAILGLMQSLTMEFQSKGLRIATVCPWFVDTAILPTVFKVFMAGIPFAPMQRVAGAIVLAATDDAPNTHGAAYTIPDEREVFRIPPTEITEGVYGLLGSRVKRLGETRQSVKAFVALVHMFARSSSAKLLVGAAVGYKAYQIALTQGLI
ncbi:NAD-binding protein [Phellopilus nigrolimitatus]|nr:NAD-binding protein [Phellopilus nigrolimitatus]